MEKYEIRPLIDKLNYYTKMYDEGHPEISDREWDDMYFQLQSAERVYNVYYKDIILIYYFAIDEELRGQGYGSRVLEYIKQKYNKNRIVLSI